MRYVLIALCFLVGCAPIPSLSRYQKATAKHTGCDKSEVVLIEHHFGEASIRSGLHHVGLHGQDWTAECNGKRYACSGRGTCKEVL